jgi:hypothetical protein
MSTGTMNVTTASTDWFSPAATVGKTMNNASPSKL